MAFFEIFRKNLFFEKKSFILLCVNFDTLYTLYTINMAKCENLLFLLPLAVEGNEFCLETLKFIWKYGPKWNSFNKTLFEDFWKRL